MSIEEKKNRITRGNAVLLMVVILISFLSGGIAGGLTKALADTLYCTILPLGNPNCMSNYCETDPSLQAGSPPLTNNCTGLNCTSGTAQVNYGDFPCTALGTSGPCIVKMTKTNISAFTSSAFTNIVSSNTPVCPAGTQVSGTTAWCTAAFDYNTAVSTTIAKIKFSSTSGGNGIVLQLGPNFATGTNETLAVQSSFNSGSSVTTLRLQVSVTGTLGTINIGPGEADCFYQSTQFTGTVG